jgi:hypothetical protein
MYTNEMGMAFRSLDHYAPNNFAVRIEDNDNFITVRADERQFMSLVDEDKRRAVEYMIRVKKALEDNGAIVLLIREGGVED